MRSDKPKSPQKKRTGGRDKDGLTNRMHQGLVILVRSDTVWAGVQECVKQGIVTDNTFYHDWINDERFLKALNEGRAKVLGEVADRVKAKALAHVDEIFWRMIQAAKGELKLSAPQLAAMQYVLDKAGVDAPGKTERTNLFAAIMVRIQNREKSPAMLPADDALANAAPTSSTIVGE